MSNQVVMKGRPASTPNGTIAMCAFVVRGITQTLGNVTPLQGKILVLIKRHTLIGTPTHRTMVDDDALLKTSTQCIGLCFEAIPHTKTKKTQNNIARININLMIGDGYAITRCRMTRNRQISVINGNAAAQLNNTGHLKNDNTRSGCGYSRAKRARTKIIQIGDLNDPSSPATGNMLPKTFGSGEGKGLFFHGFGPVCVFIRNTIIRLLISRIGLINRIGIYIVLVL